MKLFPKREFTIETKLNADEVKEKLQQLFNKKRESDFYNWVNYIIPNGKYYKGNYWGNKFYFIDDSPIEWRTPRDLFKDTTYTVYEGTINSEDKITEVFVKQRVGFLTELTTYGNVFISIVFIFLGITSSSFGLIFITLLMIGMNALKLYSLKKRFDATKTFLINCYKEKQ